MQRITIVDNEEYLRQKSKEVDFNDKSYLKDIEALKEYCQNNAVFAMAAVQISIPKRIIYLKNTTTDYTKNEDANYDEARVLINPVIINSQGKTKFLESCESCIASAEDLTKGDNGKCLAALIERPYQIEVEYYDINGNKQRETFKGFESTVFSHEYDHLNGILHIDLADEVMPMNLEERISFREAHPYEIISED